MKRLLKAIGDILETPWLWLDRLISGLPFSESMRRKISEKKYGFTGTLLVHLLALVLILVLKVHLSGMPEEEFIYIDLKTLEEIQRLETLMPEVQDQLPAAAREARNIAVNQAEDQVERYDDYRDYRLPDRTVAAEAQSRVNRTVREIIEENDLDPADRELPELVSDPLDFYQAGKIEEEQVYQGPTNIYFKLEDRKVVYLHIPVYKCQGAATVQVDIRVGKRGKVELASINGQGTDTRDPCFLDAARDAAQRTRFNFNSAAPQLQSGYIIYHFVAQ